MVITILGNIFHPLEDCLPMLQILVAEIQERQEIMYKVPFEELNSIKFTLDSTPEEDIPGFNEKYASIQSHISRVSSILIEAKREIKYWNEYKSRLKSLYVRAKNNLLINTSEIKELRNKEMQESAIQERIPDLVRLLEGLDIIIDSLESDIDIIRIKKEEIDSANVNLNRQQKVIEDMIGLNIIPTGGGLLRMRR
jgi:chromosome segregation ATPase